MSPLVGTILLLVFIALVVLVISRSIRSVPQATAGIVERFGRYHRTLNAGLNMVTPCVDRLRCRLPLQPLASQGRGRSSTRPSAVTRVSKDGWRAVAGPCTTVPSAITKGDPCQGQATQAASRSTRIRPWWRGPPRWEQRSDSTLTSPPCRYTSRDR